MTECLFKQVDIEDEKDKTSSSKADGLHPSINGTEENSSFDNLSQ